MASSVAASVLNAIGLPELVTDTPQDYEQTAIDLANHPDIKYLFPDPVAEGVRYFRKTGIYPINHGLVIKDSVLKENPWVAGELFRVFERAKAEYLKDLKGNEMSSWDKAATVNTAVVGDPFPFGIDKNRKALEAVTQFAVDQKMVPRKFSVDELFAPIG